MHRRLFQASPPATLPLLTEGFVKLVVFVVYLHKQVPDSAAGGVRIKLLGLFPTLPGTHLFFRRTICHHYHIQ